VIEAKTLQPSLKQYIRSLHHVSSRASAGECLVEGVRACESVLHTKYLPSMVVLRNEASSRSLEVARSWQTQGCTVYSASAKTMEQIADASSPQDILAVMPIPKPRTIGSRVMLLDGVADPGNAGTLLRTAAWFGFSDVVFSDGSVDPFSPKIVRSSVGSLYRLSIHCRQDIASVLASITHTVVAAVASGGQEPKAIPTTDQMAILLGSEAHGISNALLPHVHCFATVLGAGNVESLNVAVAGAILCYEWFGRS